MATRRRARSTQALATTLLAVKNMGDYVLVSFQGTDGASTTDLIMMPKAWTELARQIAQGPPLLSS